MHDISGFFIPMVPDIIALIVIVTVCPRQLTGSLGEQANAWEVEPGQIRTGIQQVQVCEQVCVGLRYVKVFPDFPDCLAGSLNHFPKFYAMGVAQHSGKIINTRIQGVFTFLKSRVVNIHIGL